MIVNNVTFVNFLTKDKLSLDGFISKSKPNNKKIVIHVHGMGGEFSRGNFLWEYVKQLKNTHYDFFSINTRGAGLITKFYLKNKKIIAGTAYEKFTDCIKDIDAAITTVEKLGYQEIILSGHSTGCQKVTYYQYKMQNSKVKAIILLSPADDHNLEKIKPTYKKDLIIANKLVVKNKENNLMPSEISAYSAKRYLSFADEKNIEAKLFNYESKLNIFSKIKCPILSTFGENDYFAKQDGNECLTKLRETTNSEFLETIIIPKADHSYKGFEKKIIKVITNFLQFLDA
ncbi:MAG: alpha/beta fold hydrolase [archaeon]|jgi:alpha-beta hydrolase superfamily lysophospholipase